MGELEERVAFDRRHASEAIEIIALIGERAGGAGKTGGAVLWTPSADMLAHIDEHDRVVASRGRLSWLATDEQRGTWIHDLKPLTQYTLRVRRATPDPSDSAEHGMPVPDLSQDFALDEVVERDIHVPALDERLTQRLQPVRIETAIGGFELERSMGWFSGVVDWCGREVMVQLEIDTGAAEGAETCAVALARLHEDHADAAAIDARWRTFAATKLTHLANEWRDQENDDDGTAPAPIAAEGFARRIHLSELSVGADGAVTPYFDDDRMFWRHVILLDVESDGSMTDAYIAG